MMMYSDGVMMAALAFVVSAWTKDGPGPTEAP